MSEIGDANAHIILRRWVRLVVFFMNSSYFYFVKCKINSFLSSLCEAVMLSNKYFTSYVIHEVWKIAGKENSRDP